MRVLPNLVFNNISVRKYEAIVAITNPNQGNQYGPARMGKDVL